MEVMTVSLAVGEGEVAVGTLLREVGLTRFVFDEDYIGLGLERPILSSSFLSVKGEKETVERMRGSSLLHGATRFRHGSLTFCLRVR